ncbi:MAG TPA: glycosyltransferase family 87 protein [Chthoniobacterales bacterium]
MTDRLRQLAARLETPRARRLIVGLFAAVAAAFTFIPVLRFLRSGTEMDYRTWFEAAQAVLQHREIYPRSGTFPFMYPPTCAVLLAAVAILGKPIMILILAVLNTIAWIFCIKFSVALASDRSPAFRTAIALISNSIVLVFIWSSYHLGQPSLLLLALMLGAFVCLRRDREVLGGALIALAAAIKAFPVLAILYLIYRRYWLAAGSLVLVLALLLLALPVPIRGFDQTMEDFRAWERGMLRYEEGGIAQRPARSYSWKNQSVWGLANRLLRHVSAEDEGKPVIYANLADLSFTIVNRIIVTIAFFFGISFVVMMPRTRRRDTDALEFGALLVLILIFTPLAFGYLFSWLMLPIAILMGTVLGQEKRNVALLSLVAAAILLVATAIAPRTAQIYGSVLLAAVALYCGLAIELWRTGPGGHAKTQ